MKAPTVLLRYHLIAARPTWVQDHLCIFARLRIDPAERLVVVVATAVHARGLAWPAATDAAATCHARIHAVHEIADVGDPTGMVDERIETSVCPKSGNPVTEALLEVLELRAVWVLHHCLRLGGRNSKIHAGYRIVRVHLRVVLG